MKSYSLAIAWNWEYDKDYILCLEAASRECGLSVLGITPTNLQATDAALRDGSVAIRALYDRASDEDEAFFSIVGQLERKAAIIVNPHQYLERARDKATMHLELIAVGINVPFTIIISPYSHRKELALSLSDLEKLGRPFIIKPANTTGGGLGVVLGAESLKDIIESRQHHKHDKYLLQEKIHPATIEGRRAWFRILHVFGAIYSCWWDDQTHVYAELTPQQEEQYHLSEIRTIMSVIQSICKLDFFSSEIALTTDGRLVVIDYVNEICDMRLQSKHPDGVPDHIVLQVARTIAQKIKAVIERPG